MRDWRLTWWAVCNLKAVAEQVNAKANKTLAILQRRLVGQIHPWTSESTVAVHQEEVASILHRPGARWECMRYFVMSI